VKRSGTTMRHIGIIILVAGSACSSPRPTFVCQTDPACDVPPKRGICVDRAGGSGVCALTDPTCPSGFRYDATSGKTSCYDAPVGSDFSMPQDMTVDVDMANPDMTMLPDLTPPPPDLIGQDLTNAPPAFYAEPSSAQLRGVWASSSSDVYAVGNGGAIQHSAGGGAWLAQTSGVTSILYSVWGSSSSDIYAVGSGGTIVHSTGTGAWTKQTSGTSSDIQRVWGSGLSDVYAVTYGGEILHSTGTGSWTKQTSGTAAALFSISGSGAGDIYATGYRQILHSTGNGVWTPITPSGTTVIYEAVYAAAANNVIVGDTTGKIIQTGNVGATWNNQTSNTTSNIVSICGTGSTNAIAVGAPGAVVQNTGSGWAAFTPPTANNIRDCWAFGPTNFYLVSDSAAPLWHFQ